MQFGLVLIKFLETDKWFFH